MNKLATIGTLCLTAALLSLSACSKKESADQVRSNGLPVAAPTADSALVAFVDIDSLATNYELCIERLAELEGKQKNLQAQLTAKGNALQTAMYTFQENYQNGNFTSQEQFDAAQAKLQKQQEQLQAFSEKIELEMSEAAAAYQAVLRDSLYSFINDYNADGRFQMILAKSGDNILYANPSLDITAEVINGLNKRYQKAK